MSILQILSRPGTSVSAYAVAHSGAGRWRRPGSLIANRPGVSLRYVGHSSQRISLIKTYTLAQRPPSFADDSALLAVNEVIHARRVQQRQVYTTAATPNVPQMCEVSSFFKIILKIFFFFLSHRISIRWAFSVLETVFRSLFPLNKQFKRLRVDSAKSD